MTDPRDLSGDDDGSPVPAVSAGVPRRRLLEAAAAGFALAASGLLLPTHVVEAAEAAQHPVRWVQSRKERHRTHQHRHRHHHGHRHHPRNKNKHDRRDDAEPSGLLLGVALFLHNLRPTAVAVREWVFTTPGNTEIATWVLKTGWLTIDGKPPSGPEPFIDFVEDTLQLAVEINTGHIIWVGNPPLGFPWTTIGTGGWSTDGWNARGTTLIDQGFFEGETARAPGFVAQRLNDTDTHKRFLVNLI